MQLRAAVLCDYAEVREGLLTIVSAGVTRLWRPELPAPLGVFLAVQIELTSAERRMPHELSITITGPSGAELVQARTALQMAPEADGQFDADESALVSLPLDLRTAGANEYGWIRIVITGDDLPLGELRVKLARPPAAQVPGAPMPAPRARRPH